MKISTALTNLELQQLRETLAGDIRNIGLTHEYNHFAISLIAAHGKSSDTTLRAIHLESGNALYITSEHGLAYIVPLLIAPIMDRDMLSELLERFSGYTDKVFLAEKDYCRYCETHLLYAGTVKPSGELSEKAFDRLTDIYLMQHDLRGTVRGLSHRMDLKLPDWVSYITFFLTVFIAGVLIWKHF